MTARVVLNVTAVNGPEIHTKVHVGGPLSNNKGINRKGGGLSAPALTDKDKADMITAAEIGADFLAISFPREAADIHLSRDLMKKAGGKSLIIAKIERTEAYLKISKKFSKPQTASWSPVAIWVSKSAMPLCLRYRSA